MECLELIKEYRMGSGRVVRALNGVNLSVCKGEFVGIVGPSGAGKSTLLHIIGLLERPDGGELRIHGADAARIPKRRVARFRNRKVGFVFQRIHLLPTLNALENVMLPLRYRRMPRREAQLAAEAILTEVGLADRLRHRPGELSGGQRQRVAVARALVTDPDLVLADEPTGELDSESSRELVALLRRINEERHQTIVLVTHDRDVVQACDRTIQMRNGVVVDERLA